MDFQAILQKNALKTYAVLAIYVLIFLLIGLLVDIVRINAPSLEYGFYLLLSLREFPLITALTSLVAVCIIWYSLSRFDAIMLSGDEYEELPQGVRLKPLQARVRNALDDVLRRSSSATSPRLYLIQAPYMNAFASGWSGSNSLIAITKALALSLDDQEAKGCASPRAKSYTARRCAADNVRGDFKQYFAAAVQ